MSATLQAIEEIPTKTSGSAPTTTGLIRYYNDLFRLTFDDSMGMVILTPGVEALSPLKTTLLVSAVQQFKDFSGGNDPWREHDFGKITLFDTDFFFKIDYYDLSYSVHSEVPESLALTRRVLTIMKASEY